MANKIVEKFVDDLLQDQLKNSFKLSVPLYNGLNISDSDMTERDLFGSNYDLKYNLEQHLIDYTYKKFGYFYMEKVNRLLVITDLRYKDCSNKINSFSRLFVSYKIYDIKNNIITKENSKSIDSVFVENHSNDLVLRYTEQDKHFLTVWTIEKNSYSFVINQNKWNMIDTLDMDSTLYFNFDEECLSLVFYGKDSSMISFYLYKEMSLDGEYLFEGFKVDKDKSHILLDKDNIDKSILMNKTKIKLDLYNIDIDNLYESIRDFMIKIKTGELNIVKDDIRNKKLTTSFERITAEYKTHIDILFYSMNKNKRDTINRVGGNETKRIILGQENTLKRFTNDTNPLSYLSDLRKIKITKSKGGRVVNEMRDYNDSMMYAISPNETPESQEIGLLVNRCFGTYIDNEKNFILSKNNILGEKFDTQINDLNSCLIPFIKNVDANRVLFSVNHIKQTIATNNNSTPLISTGIERLLYKYKDIMNGHNHNINNEKTIYKKYIRDTFSDSEWKVDDTFFKDGHTALGVYGTMALTPILGYDYEDGIIISESFARKIDQVYLNVITLDIEYKNVKFLPSFKIGDKINKSTPVLQYYNVKKVASVNFSDKVLETKTFDVDGEIVRIDYYDENNKLYSEFNKNIIKIIYYVSTSRKTEVGDKLSCMVGMKGIITKILPDDEMPYCENGRKIDIIMNCISMINRMTIGIVHQNNIGDVSKYLNEFIKNSNNPVDDFIYVLDEIYKITEKESLKIYLDKVRNLNEIEKEMLKYILKNKGFTLELKQFEDIRNEDIFKLLEFVSSKINSEVSKDGTFRIYLPFLGKLTKDAVSIGTSLVLPLKHKVKDKMSSTSLKGMSSIKEKKQRLGEMEIWALESYNTSNLLNEVLNIKSNKNIERDLIKDIKGDGWIDLEDYQIDSPSKIELECILKCMGLNIIGE